MLCISLAVGMKDCCRDISCSCMAMFHKHTQASTQLSFCSIAFIVPEGAALEWGHAGSETMSDCLQCCTQVMNETLTKSMSSADTTSGRYEQDRDKLVPAKDLIDAKKRMLATLKKKQAEFAKRVRLPPYPTSIFTALQSSQHDRQASIFIASILVSRRRHLISI